MAETPRSHIDRGRLGLQSVPTGRVEMLEARTESESRARNDPDTAPFRIDRNENVRDMFSGLLVAPLAHDPRVTVDHPGGSVRLDEPYELHHGSQYIDRLETRYHTVRSIGIL